MSQFKLRCQIEVRPSDLDSLAHVNNAVYFSYLEIARGRYWTHLFDGQRRLRDDVILARAELDYRSQATDDDLLVVEIRTSRIGRSSFEFTYRIVGERDGRLIAEGRSVQVMFDYTNNQKILLPKSVRGAILEFEGEENVERSRVDGDK